MKTITLLISMIVSISLFSQRGLQNNAHIRVYDGTVLKISGNSNYGDFINNNDMQNDGMVYISGNITNNGHADMSVPGTTDEGVFIFNGSMDQIINGTDSIIFENLKMDGSSVTLKQSIVIMSKLRFNNGIIRSQQTSPVYFENGSVSVNATGGSGFFDVASDESHVAGPVVKIGDEDFVFPVGSGTTFRPASVKNLSTSTRFTAEYFQEDASDYGYYVVVKYGLHHVSSCEFWNIEPDDACSASIVLSWSDSSCGVNAINDLRVAHWYDDKWISEGNVAISGNTTQGTLSSGTVNTFSPFTLASISPDNPLPVELSKVWMENDFDLAHIYWETVSEINNDHFTIEKSKDLTNWKPAGIIQGAGNSSNPLDYAFTDGSFDLNTDKYYRLKQTDFDGKFTYSKVLTVTPSIKETHDFSYSANQGNLIVFAGSDYGQEVLIEIISTTGETVFSKPVFLHRGSQEIHLPLGLEKGIYMISLNTGEHRKTLKAIL